MSEASTRARRVGGIAYAVAPSPTQASVAGFVVGLGWLCSIGPMTVATIISHSDATRWLLVAAGFAIVAIQSVVMAIDLTRLMGDQFRTPSALRALNQVISCMVAATLIGYGLGGSVADVAYRSVLIMSVLTAATIGSDLFIAIVIGAALVLAMGPLIASGQDAGSLVVLGSTYIAVGLGAAAVVREIRSAGVRAAARFDRLTETTEVILRADGFEEALARFLPLVAAQVGTDRISAFLIAADGTRRSLPGYGPPPDPTSMAARVATTWSPPTGPANGFVIGPEHTIAWAWSEDGRIAVLVVHCAAPAWRQRVAVLAALRQLAPELELLLRHTDLLTQLDALSRTDALTGLPNRLELVDRIGQEQARAQRTSEPLAVAMIDLDEFKRYNDTYGHLEGDHALASLGQLFSARIRKADFMCRFGGEEFCLVMPDTDADSARFLLDQLRTLAGALPGAGPISFSAGVAVWHDGQRVEDLLGEADAALYRAKAAGRHQTVSA